MAKVLIRSFPLARSVGKMKIKQAKEAEKLE